MFAIQNKPNVTFVDRLPPPLFVKQLPKSTHPSPKPPKQYNDYSVKLNMEKWKLNKKN
jgi:hypothetical protein